MAEKLSNLWRIFYPEIQNAHCPQALLTPKMHKDIVVILLENKSKNKSMNGQGVKINK